MQVYFLIFCSQTIAARDRSITNADVLKQQQTVTLLREEKKMKKKKKTQTPFNYALSFKK